MKYKQPYNLVFSDKRSYRWKRHFLFWLAVYIYHLLRIGLMMPPAKNFFELSPLFYHAFFWGVIASMLLTYPVVYYLVPKKLNQRKYLAFIAGLLVLIVLLQLYGIVWKVLWDTRTIKDAIGISGSAWRSAFRPGFIRLFGNPPLICGLFLAIKILKNWHLEQLRTETLAKESANAELQLLKAQIHPHFLFNTLNNIYSFSLYQSPQAGTLVKKLSGMLDYMIHECEEKLVPLEKELQLIQDYMGLEKVRYGKRLDMQVEMHGDFENKLIAPLLMIPFVENSFKHGTSQMLQHPWIKLQITTIDNHLFLKLSNSKPLLKASKQIKGIGLLNVTKRLQLLYPDSYQLNIESTDDTFIVQMQIMLNERNFGKSEKTEISSSEKLAYA